jgi:hypothetical protein
VDADRRARPSLRQRFVARRHTALLVAIIAAFALRPLVGDTGLGPALFSGTIVLVLLVGLYTIEIDTALAEPGGRPPQWQWVRIVGGILALAAIGERVEIALAPTRMLFLAGPLAWLLLFAYVTLMELRGVLRHRAITTETISMAISVYLLLGITWGILYIVIFELQPSAFGFGAADQSAVAADQAHVFPIFIYFSLTTLATIGFGDIVPVSLQARYAAVAEGITGQLYLAILVARLVGLYSGRPIAKDRPGDTRAAS